MPIKVLMLSPPQGNIADSKAPTVKVCKLWLEHITLTIKKITNYVRIRVFMQHLEMKSYSAKQKEKKKKNAYHNLLGDAVRGLRARQLPVPLICTYGSSETMTNIIRFLATPKTTQQ